MTKSMIAALAASILAGSAAGHAFADRQEAEPVSRQQIVAELARARRAGEIAADDTTYPLTPPRGNGTVTRAQVRAELLRARAAGEMNYTDATYPLAGRTSAAGLTREAVRGEAARALAAGELDTSEARDNGPHHQHDGTDQPSGQLRK